MNTLLAEDVVPRRPLAGTMWMGATRGRGATAGRTQGGAWRRAEHGSVGPLLFEVRPRATEGDADMALQVWGPAATPAAEAERALGKLRGWIGLEDAAAADFADLVGDHPVLRECVRQLGVPIIGALPRASESFLWAVCSQLVQGVEAARSVRQLTASLGVETPSGLFVTPTPTAIGSLPAHEMRRFGISLRNAKALHLFAVHAERFQQAADQRDHRALEVLTRRVPGCGVWTASEVRLYLGDPDAVSYGDYHLPHIVGWAIGERTETDEAMAELLAPYAPQRGRVIKLLERAASKGIVDARPRRGPRAALSAHRYW